MASGPMAGGPTAGRRALSARRHSPVGRVTVGTVDAAGSADPVSRPAAPSGDGPDRTGRHPDMPLHARVCTADMDEARAFCQEMYYGPLNFRPVGSVANLDFAGEVVRIGPVTIGEVSYGTDVGISTTDLTVAYHILAPVTGGLRSHHRGSLVVASASRAAFYRPIGDIDIAWPGSCRLFSVKVTRDALERELGAAYGLPCGPPPALGPSFDLTGGPGRSWLSLVRQLHAEVRDPDSVIRTPQLARRWAQLVVSGLALTVEHPHRDDVAGRVPAMRPRSVKRTLDAMHADPARSFTAPELAAVAGVGTRLLQEAFRRHVGMPPLTYLRELRLDRVHAELSRCDPYRTSVGEVAVRWGFTHLGRFAAAYRARYGVPPSRTLRDRR